MRPFHSYDLRDRGVLEPGEVFERNKQFLISQKPCLEMLVTSASEMCLPSAADFILMLLD